MTCGNFQVLPLPSSVTQRPGQRNKHNGGRVSPGIPGSPGSPSTPRVPGTPVCPGGPVMRGPGSPASPLGPLEPGGPWGPGGPVGATPQGKKNGLYEPTPILNSKPVHSETNQYFYTGFNNVNK